MINVTHVSVPIANLVSERQGHVNLNDHRDVGTNVSQCLHLVAVSQCDSDILCLMQCLHIMAGGLYKSFIEDAQMTP